MAADVVFTTGEPWYTNSESWHRIAGFALSGLEGPSREEYARYVSAPPGIDFPSLPAGKPAEVARWLCRAVEAMLAVNTWEDTRSQTHVRELARRLHSEIEAEEPEGSPRTSPPDPAPETAAVSGSAVSDRQAALLAVVAEGGGDWDARRIDLAVDARHGPGEGTVLRELEELARLGLVIRDDTRSGIGGRWSVTASAARQ